MKNSDKKNNSVVVKMSCGWLFEMLAPSVVHACACGCGVFDVATSSMLPAGQGGMAYVTYDYMDQNINWKGTSPRDASQNPDKNLRTHFLAGGVQYMFTRAWGAEIEVP